MASFYVSDAREIISSASCSTFLAFLRPDLLRITVWWGSKSLISPMDSSFSDLSLISKWAVCSSGIIELLDGD